MFPNFFLWLLPLKKKKKWKKGDLEVVSPRGWRQRGGARENPSQVSSTLWHWPKAKRSNDQPPTECKWFLLMCAPKGEKKKTLSSRREKKNWWVARELLCFSLPLKSWSLSSSLAYSSAKLSCARGPPAALPLASRGALRVASRCSSGQQTLASSPCGYRPSRFTIHAAFPKAQISLLYPS